MLIAKTTKVMLKKDVSNLTVGYVERVNQWLKQWTCENNFQNVIAENEEEAVKLLREDLVKAISFHQDFNVEDFRFHYSVSEVKNNRFWNNSPYICCTEYKIVE